MGQVQEKSIAHIDIDHAQISYEEEISPWSSRYYEIDKVWEYPEKIILRCRRIYSRALFYDNNFYTRSDSKAGKDAIARYENIKFINQKRFIFFGKNIEYIKPGSYIQKERGEWVQIEFHGNWTVIKKL